LIGQSELSQKSLTFEEKKKLFIYLQELKSRGQPIPEGIVLPKSKNEIGWNLDSNGYFIRNDGRHFNPNDGDGNIRQEIVDFIEDDARLILLKSGRGGSKTCSAIQKVLRKVKAGESGAVMNPDFENFRTSTWPEFRDWIPWQMVVPKHRFRSSISWEPIKPFSIVFINGAKVYCKGLKDPESARGANINFFWYDEGRRDPTGLGWKNAIALCRVGHKPQAFCTTTMAGLDHWTNTFFNDNPSEEFQKIVDELKKTGKDQKMFSIHKTSTERNKQNLDPMFYATLLTTHPSGYLRVRELEGEAADEGGSLGDRAWFIGKSVPKEPEWVVKKVRFWDLAGTAKKILTGKKMNDPDESVGSLVGTDEEKDSLLKKFVILDQVGGHWEWSKLKDMIVSVTNADGPSVYVCFEQEPASGGKNQVAELKALLKKECPWVQFSKGKKSTDIDGAWNPKDAGDRVMGANTWFAEAQTTEVDGVVHEGQWYYVSGLWTEKFFSQLDTFNGIAHDDRITSITGARHVIAPIQKKWSSPKFLALTGEPSTETEKKEVPLALH
jgi:phage terminase large subunit-like protein